MAVPEGPTDKRYTGNGVTKIFTIPFLLLAATDLDVYIDGIEISSGFAITNVGNPTSTITFTVAPVDQADIYLQLNVPFERLNDYQENGDFLSSTVNRDFDRIWQALKQLFRWSTRSLRLGNFDVDGAGWYRAKGNGIRDLKDPEVSQDAATLGWSKRFFSELIESVSGLVNTTTGIFYDAGTLFDYLKYGLSRRVDNVGALRLLSSSRNQRARTLGYYSKGDKGGGDFYVDPDDTTTPDNGVTVIVGADGARWKLVYRSLHIKQAGAIEGADIAPLLNMVGSILYSDGGGRCRINGTYKLGQKVNMYPNVELVGGGSGRRNRLELSHGGTAFETYRPVGYAPGLCIDSDVSKLTLVGMGVGVGTCFSIRNAMQCTISKNEIANFNIAFHWNSGSTPANVIQSFFNVIKQNIIKPCGIAHYFGGAANRNTFDTNSIADNRVAYDFSQPDNWSETNLFLNENVEGCRTWAEWGAAVYSQTWEGLTIENPSSNGFVCTVKDPGRQVIKNLALIPLGNEEAITKYTLHDKPSLIIGSAGSSGENRLGVSIPEPLDMYDIIQHHTHHASATYSGAINAGASASFDITLATAKLNDRVDVYALRSIFGCVPVAWAGNGVVHVVISNPLTYNVVIPNTEISVILKRAF